MVPANVVSVLCSQGATTAAEARPQPPPSASRSPSASGFNHTPAEAAGESPQQNECHILSSILSAETLCVTGDATTGGNREEGGSSNSAAGTAEMETGAVSAWPVEGRERAAALSAATMKAVVVVVAAVGGTVCVGGLAVAPHARRGSRQWPSRLGLLAARLGWGKIQWHN